MRFVFAFGQIGRAVTPLGVGQGDVILAGSRSLQIYMEALAPRNRAIVDLSYNDFGVYRRFAGDGHAPADRSRVRAVVSLRRLRVGDGEDGEKNCPRENQESGDSKHSGLLEGRREAAAGAPQLSLNVLCQNRRRVEATMTNDILRMASRRRKRRICHTTYAIIHMLYEIWALKNDLADAPTGNMPS